MMLLGVARDKAKRVGFYLVSGLDLFVSDSLWRSSTGVSSAWPGGGSKPVGWLPTLATIPAWRTSGRLCHSMSGQVRSSGAKGMRSPVYWALLGLVIER